MNNNIKKQHTQYLSQKISVNYFFIESKIDETKEKTFEDIFSQIKENKDFELGEEYTSEEKLKEDLRRKIFGNSDFKKLVPFGKNEQKIYKTLLDIFQKSFNTLPIQNDITVYIIPFCNKEASEDLKGVNASPVEKNILYLFIDVLNPEWEQSLIETIPHEYAHLVYTDIYSWNSILDGFVNEGLAEHFREHLIGGEQAPWSLALSKENALAELAKIDEEKVLNLFIDDSNVDFYVSYFFGTNDLPNWYGYSIGYWMIHEILEKTNINIIELFNLSPKEIFMLFKKTQS